MTSATLKIIAIVAMFIDHFAAIFITNPILYFIMRIIGRLTLPIMAYFIVEGYIHTSSIQKYALRLLLFALISEIPFDLAFFNQTFYFNYNNIFFTLFLGLLAIWGYDYYKQKDQKLISSLIPPLAMILAYIMHVDYNCFGVLIIFYMYLYRNNDGKYISFAIINTIMSFFMLYEFSLVNFFLTTQLYALLAIPLLKKYNGQRGISLKYFFYWFYPTHLFVFFIIKLLIEIY